ncbi:transposase [bacterium]|nr:transposase [bacterium]MBU1982980.1 transposase [bacterium]
MLPKRKSIRLRAYDYTRAGVYFVTLCTHDRKAMFGEIRDGMMHANTVGEIIVEEWFRSKEIRVEIELDEFVLMPNHIHGLVVIIAVGAHGDAPASDLPLLHRSPQSLASFIAGFKRASAKRINILHGTPGNPVWQRNYFERVICNEDGLNKAREYIINNPLRWELDRENPDRIK